MMKSIIRFSMRNGTALFLMILLIVAGGILSLKEMNIEKYPNVDIPYLTAVIPYPGASPEQVMQEIGEPVEREFLNLDGVKNVYTDAAANAVYATMEFEMDTDMDEAEQVARSAIAKIKLPENAEAPEFIHSGPDPDPTIFSMGIYAEEDPLEVQKFVSSSVIPRLEAIEGVSKVESGGIEGRMVSIRLLPEELQNKGITIDDVKAGIKANNLSIPTGDITLSNEVLPVRAGKELESLDDVKNIRLFTNRASSENPQQPEVIRLSDIAEITYENENSGTFTRINGDPGVRIGIMAEGGANTVAIVDEAKKAMEEISLPVGYETEILRDQSIEIKDSVYSMLREAILGAVMAVIVTLLFLRNIRSTIIAVISIPLSILGSFTVMHMLGYTLNIMTLAGIAVAVGRVVDDSIVVIENVFRRVRASRERNERLVEKSTREVASAITSSTITTVAVFLPMAFVPGIVGAFFKPLAWTIVVSLLISLLVAITVVPLMSKIFLLNISPQEHKETFLQKGYRKSLNWALKHRIVTMTMSLFLLVGSVILIAPQLGTTFLPQEKVNDYDISIKMEKGTSPEITNETALKVEDILLHREEIERVSTSVSGEFETASVSFAVKDSLENTDRFIEDLRGEFAGIKEAEEISVTGVGGIVGGSDSQYMLVVNGSDFADIKKASEEIVSELKNVAGLTDISTSLEGDEPEIELVFNEEQLAEKGLMPSMVGQGLRNLMNGDVVTTMTVDDEQTDVKLQLKIDDISSLEELGNQKVNNILGMPVALNEVGKLQRVNNRTLINHLNTNEYVMVFAQMTDANTGNVTAKADEVIAQLDLPDTVSYYKEGASAAMADGFKNLTIAIAVSIVLVYMVMVIAFGEGKAPFVILFAIPFSVIGALLGLFIVGEPIGMPAMIGLLMLNGIVVTNAIVLVDKVKQNEKAGMGVQESLIEAGVVRIRPILMTAIATIGALMPMAVSSHSGIVSASLAVVVIGGLTTSTLLTLYIVPVLYSLFNLKSQEKTVPSARKLHAQEM